MPEPGTSLARKPEPLLFELALKKADLQPRQVWYCGNSIRADVFGAQNAGIFPVFYEELTIDDPACKENAGLQIDFPHLYIHKWAKLIDAVNRTEAE